jgi:hypothetical protein
MGSDEDVNLREERVDQWLDRALRRYGDVEPRAGLEQRIFTNVARAESERDIGTRWQWAFALTALTGVIAFAIWMGSGATHHARGPVASLTLNQMIAKSSQVRPARAPRRGPRKNPRQISRAARPNRAEREPRLAQFPSPRPLTEQEQMLRRYVTELPQEAVLVAQAQAERQKEIDKLFEKESNIEFDQ